MHREGPGSPRPHPDNPPRHRHITMSCKANSPEEKNGSFQLFLFTGLVLSLSFNIPTSGLLSARHDQTTPPPTRFCGTSTLVFSTTAESFLLPLLLPEMGACVVLFVYLMCQRCRTGLYFASAATIRPKIQSNATTP